MTFISIFCWYTTFVLGYDHEHLNWFIIQSLKYIEIMDIFLIFRRFCLFCVFVEFCCIWATILAGVQGMFKLTFILRKLAMLHYLWVKASIYEWIGAGVAWKIVKNVGLTKPLESIERYPKFSNASSFQSFCGHVFCLILILLLHILLLTYTIYLYAPIINVCTLSRLFSQQDLTVYCWRGWLRFDFILSCIQTEMHTFSLFI